VDLIRPAGLVAAYERIIAGDPVTPLRRSGVWEDPARPRRRTRRGAACRPHATPRGL